MLSHIDLPVVAPATPIREGAYIQTYTGKRFYPMDPRPEEIDIEDIAHALSNICRFTGHTKSFYSVAQHCFHASFYVSDEHALAALLHDASEAYLADIAKPVKSLYALRDYEVVEDIVMRAIAGKFGFSYPLHGEIKEVDAKLLFTEKRDLLPVSLDWGYQIEPYPFELSPWSPSTAKEGFLFRFEELMLNVAQS